MISVLIADNNYLSRLGLYTLLSTSSNFEVDYTEDENFEMTSYFKVFIYEIY